MALFYVFADGNPGATYQFYITHYRNQYQWSDDSRRVKQIT